VLGIAGAIYFAALASRVDLRIFYPIWVAAGFASCIARLRRKLTTEARQPWDVWVPVLLALVGAIRFAIVLPRVLPEGAYDPTFHLIIAQKIQITQHAMYDWEPFEKANLYYPSGVHTLIVVLSAISRLALHTVFKNMVALAGVLSTGVMYVFARRVSTNDRVALWSAAAYGLWAWFGSNDYIRWGGLPSETAMLLLLTFLSISLDTLSMARRVSLMALVYAALLLAHHHTIIDSALILAVIFLAAPALRKTLAAAVLVAVAADLFFIVPYLLRVISVHSTTALNDSEPALTFLGLLGGFGYVFGAMTVAGIVAWLVLREPPLHAMVFCAVGVLGTAFLATEYVVPLVMCAFGHKPAIAFGPSRFVTDLNYFLAVFVGIAICQVQNRVRWKHGWIVLGMCVAAGLDYGQWRGLVKPSEASAPPAGFIAACDWIHDHTPASTVVLNRDHWTTYLTWRRTTFMPFPECCAPVPDHGAEWERYMGIISGMIHPDALDMTFVKIMPADEDSPYPRVWSGEGYKVVQVWPGAR
jgi:hypothetical protein